MRFLFAAIVLFLAITAVNAKVYFKETFSDNSWKSRWVESNWKKSTGEQGAWKLTSGDFYGNQQDDQGLQTSQDARFYALTSKLSEEFNNKNKDLILQFSVKHQQNIDCGGGYIKLLPPQTNQQSFSGDSDYNIMFGPDICGHSTKRIHVIFNHNGENKLIKKDIPCETDRLSHVYTLIVHPNQTYEVLIDGQKKDGGSLIDDWDFLPPKMIKDPSVSKPSDWVDDMMIDDPSDIKPSNWDDIPRMIPDPDASKPDDWDDDDDGDWEAPMIENPEYKGEWKARRISNPAYKGPWTHPMIANPEYKDDDNIAVYDNAYVGFDLWQVKSGTIFDNIIVTDNMNEANELFEQTWMKNHQAEKDMMEKLDNQKAEEERKAAEAAKAATSIDDDDEDEDDDDDDDEDYDDDKDEL